MRLSTIAILLPLLTSSFTDAFMPSSYHSVSRLTHDRFQISFHSVSKFPHRTIRSHLKCTLRSVSSVDSDNDKVRLPPPPKDLLDAALHNAECLIRDAGGCLDSIHFGHAWKAQYPDFTRERFNGTQVTSFNKLLKARQ